MEKFWRFASKKQTSITSAAFVLSFMVLFSRLLGLVRDRMLSARFTPDELGVYFAAFRIPNVIFELLVMGALTSAFIPVYTKYLSTGDEKQARRIASVLINLSVCLLVFVSIPLFIGSRFFSQLLAPGFDESQIALMSDFTRFILLFQVGPLLIGNIFTGILQSHSYFFVPALAPVVYNIGILVGIFFLVPTMGLWGPVIGVGIGAVIFAAIQLPLLIKIGYRHTLEANPKVKGVAEVGRLMGPRTFGLAVAQIDTTVDLILASLLGSRMVTIFNFAQHLQQLPIGLFGMTLAQAALPSLSHLSALEKKDEFIKAMQSVILKILFFVLPASALFMVLRIPVVRLVFGAAHFDWTATVSTGMTLSAFSISMFAQAISQVLVRGFYALYDSKTPVVIGVICVLFNSLLSCYFILYLHLPVWYLGIATSLASMLHASLLLLLLHKKTPGLLSFEFCYTASKMIVAAVITGVALYIPLKLLDQLVFDTTRTFGLLLLTGISGSIGMITYLFLSWVIGVDHVQSVYRLAERIGKLRGFVMEPVQEVVNGGSSDKLT